MLPALAASGHLDRDDLLTRSLLALRRDFRRPLLTWFKSVFSVLSPTVAERLTRQSELLDLLAHPLPLVINFALEQLKDVWAEPAFNPAPLLQYADGLMTRPDLKTGIKALLGTFEKLLKRTPTLAPTLARLATTALSNADTAVQARAAKLLLAIADPKKPLLSANEMGEITAAIAQYAGLLSAEARSLLAPFLPIDLAPEPGAEPAAPYVPRTEFVPDISPTTAIAPVADWHELLFLTGTVLKNEDPAALERWVDGLLRLREQFPEGYAEQLRPYLQQASGWEMKDVPTSEMAEVLLRHEFIERRNSRWAMAVALLHSWFMGFLHPQVLRVALAEQQYSRPDPLLTAEKQRLAAAEARLHPAALPLTLLSTPTHAPHWVAPTALVNKLLAYETAAQLPDAADLAMALARCAWQAEPDATAARTLLLQLPPNGLRELLMWFLTPAERATPPAPTRGTATTTEPAAVQLLARLLPPAPQSLPDLPAPQSLPEALPWLWAVAARTRYPHAALPPLHQLSDCVGLAKPWLPDWQFVRESRTHNQGGHRTWTELRVLTPQSGQRPPSPLLLYSQHARLSQKRLPEYLWSLNADLAFFLSLFPHAPASLHWHVLRTACRTDTNDSDGRQALLLTLRSLLLPGPVFDESASLLLTVGLAHFAPACRALALEVMLTAVPTGRLRPEALGTTLGRLLAAEFAPMQRLTDGLTQARAIDPTTDDALHQVLDNMLIELPATPPRNLRKLLELYAELRTRTPRAIPAAVLDRLHEWQVTATLNKVIASLLR